MTTVEILRAARAKVEQGWTQGWVARDRDGNAVIPWFPAACSWCAVGAISAVAGGSMSAGMARSLLELAVPSANKSITVYNDARGRTQEEVLAWFDDAIELAEGEVAR